MKIKGITDECFSDYRKPVMFIAMPTCTFKCDEENGCEICQNHRLALEPDIEITKEQLIERYLANPITKAIVFGGLEPFDSLMEVVSFVDCLRRQYKCNDDVIIYTGYTEEEVSDGIDETAVGRSLIKQLFQMDNIIIKYGRFRANYEPHYDDVLGVKLASPNQYAIRYMSATPNPYAVYCNNSNAQI